MTIVWQNSWILKAVHWYPGTLEVETLIKTLKAAEMQKECS